MSKPKLVIVSNHCVSQSDANGRSLLNLLGEFSSEQLFQIYSANDDLSSRFCADYLQLSNGNAVRGVLGLGKLQSYAPSYIQPEAGAVSAGNMKNAATMLLRDLVWRYSFGMKRVIKSWAKKIQPDAVLLQLGDSANLVDIATTVAKCCKVPVITYNTEDYYFKNYDYMKRTDKGNLLFNIFQSRFRRVLRRFFKRYKALICNCYGLKDLFDKEFGLSSEVVYTASAMERVSEADEQGVISYCGNLGVGRHRSLIEVANALSELNPDLKLEVYGNAPNEQIKAELDSCEGINFHGVVSYEKVQEIIKSSRLLLHVEGFDPYITMDTRYAFSTKLADYCRSGVPMLVYAPDTGEGIAYVRQNCLGFTLSNKAELLSVLKSALEDNVARSAVTENAVKAAQNNHDITANGMRVYKIIEGAIKAHRAC